MNSTCASKPSVPLLGAGTEPPLGRAVAQVEADAATLTATATGQAEHARAVGLRRVEDRPALRVAARAVGLEQQLPVGDVRARVSPRLRPHAPPPAASVVVVGRGEEGAARLALGDFLFVRLARCRRAAPRGRRSRVRSSSTGVVAGIAERSRHRGLRFGERRGRGGQIASCAVGELHRPALPCALAATPSSALLPAPRPASAGSTGCTRRGPRSSARSRRRRPATPNACIGVPGRP